MGEIIMNSEQLRKLVIDTGILLGLEVEQINDLNVAIKLAYTSGYRDGNSEWHKPECEDSGVLQCVCDASRIVNSGELI
jgi:hypothetical protein